MKSQSVPRPMAGLSALLSIVKFNDQGLIPAIIQDVKSKQVLTLCYLNQEAFQKCLETGLVYLFRRSQNRLMQKGESSGHIQIIRQVRTDCEGRSLLFLIQQRIAACHAGYFTCYFRQLDKSGRLRTKGKRIFNPEKVYRKS